jgi:hypothetical protein|tara:strand:+ start:64 stop:327 length:264 start_codon:yes stop_codon:yes gene_type:complete
MTEHTDVVEEQRQRIRYDDWRNEVKYLQANNGKIELAFNDGRVRVEDTKTGKIKMIYPEGYMSKDWMSSVLERFKKAIVNYKNKTGE